MLAAWTAVAIESGDGLDEIIEGALDPLRTAGREVRSGDGILVGGHDLLDDPYVLTRGKLDH